MKRLLLFIAVWLLAIGNTNALTMDDCLEIGPSDLRDQCIQNIDALPVPWLRAWRQTRAQGDPRSYEKFAADCEAGINTSVCGGMPSPKDCRTGYHWSWAGTGIAHCAVTANCVPPQTKVVDSLGNESCVTPLYCPPPNQTIQCVDASCSNCPAPPGCTPDGSTSEVLFSSTPCPPGQQGGPIEVYNTYNSCGQLIGTRTEGSCQPTCTGNVETATQACPPPLAGTQIVTTIYDCNGNVVDVSIDTSGCSCPTTSSVETNMCSDGTTTVTTTAVTNCYGQIVSVTTLGVCPGYCPDGVTPSNPDQSNCPRCQTGELWTDPMGGNCPCTDPVVTTTTGYCSALNPNWAGSYTITTTTQCDGSSTVTEDSGSACSCANGANNFPTCSLACMPDGTTHDGALISSTACAPGYTGGPMIVIEVLDSCNNVVGTRNDGSCTYIQDSYCPPPNTSIACNVNPDGTADCSNCPVESCTPITLYHWPNMTTWEECVSCVYPERVWILSGGCGPGGGPGGVGYGCWDDSWYCDRIGGDPD